MFKTLDTNQIYILIDALVYIAMLATMLLHKRKLNQGVVFFTISHIGTIPYYNVLTNYGSVISIYTEAYIFLYLMILLTVWPFYKYDNLSHVSMQRNGDVIKILIVLLFIGSLIPLMENIAIFARTGLHGNYGEIYDMRRDGELDIYSPIAKILQRWTGYFRFVVLGLFFLSLKTYKKNKIWVWMLAVIQVNSFLTGVNISSRGSIFGQLAMYLCIFLFLIKTYKEEVVTKIMRWGVLAVIPLLLFIVIITNSRHDNKETKKSTSTSEWVLLYLSEGPIKFSNEMWKGRHNTGGDVNLNYAKDMIGMKTYKTYEERDNHYIYRNGRRIEVFYTYIGDFVSDFDYIGAVVICALLFLLEYNILRRGNLMSFNSFIIILILIQLHVYGFASNVFRAYGGQKTIVYTLIQVSQAPNLPVLTGKIVRND